LAAHEASIGRCQPKLDYLHATYLKTLDAMKESPAAYAYGLMPREDVTPQSCEDAKAKVEAAYKRASSSPLTGTRPLATRTS
jgi:3-hydroxybutyryl-CoA dehydrogenase